MCGGWTKTWLCKLWVTMKVTVSKDESGNEGESGSKNEDERGCNKSEYSREEYL